MAGKRKGTYKVRNWSTYNECLVQRGSIILWFNEEALGQWLHTDPPSKRGHPFVYSHIAITCLLVVRELFRLPYRQLEGLARSIMQCLKLDLPVPDYTTLAKRAARLGAALKVRPRRGPIDVVVDSTGLKVYGQGEWRVRQQGKSRRRTWRKVHLAVDPATQEIVAEVLTDPRSDDASQVEELLEQVPARVRRFYGDGAYDQRKVYWSLGRRGAEGVIPPRRGARIERHGNCTGPPLARDVAIRGVRDLGRRRWKSCVGYHRRSLVETAVSRLKGTFGDRLKNRVFATQRTEIRLRCEILNRFTQLGLPRFEWV